MRILDYLTCLLRNLYTGQETTVRIGHETTDWSQIAQSCPTLCDPMDCSLPGFSIHGILQARILEWIAISFSRRSSWPRDWTQVSHLVGRCFNHLSHQGSLKLGTDYVYCHPAYLAYMQGTSCKLLGWMKHKLESRSPEEVSISSDMQMTPSLWQKVKGGTKEPLDERGEWKNLA